MKESLWRTLGILAAFFPFPKQLPLRQSEDYERITCRSMVAASACHGERHILPAILAPVGDRDGARSSFKFDYPEDLAAHRVKRHEISGRWPLQ